MALARVTAQFSESVIRRTTIHALKFKAVNLAQGFPDEDTPDRFKEAAIEAIRSGRNKYSDTWGTQQLRGAVAGKMRRLYGVDIDPDKNVTVTCGSTESMAAALFATVNRGDEVVIFEPAYENFVPQCLLAGATPKLVPLMGDDFQIDRDRFVNALGPKTAAIILNNPNNPSGRVFSREELAFIGETSSRIGAYVIADEVYEHLVYDGNEHITLPSVRVFGDRWIVISSCSKTYYITGWRVGYVIAPEETMTGIRRCHDFLTGMAPTPFQEAACVALSVGDDYYVDLRKRFRQRRSMLCDALVSVDIGCRPPAGAYYILADMSTYDFSDSTDFCERLLREVGVAAVPWRSFYSDYGVGRYKVRFTFSKSGAQLTEASRRLNVGLQRFPRRRHGKDIK